VLANPEKVRAQKRRWYARHREECLAYLKKRYAAVPEKIKESVRRTRASKLKRAKARKHLEKRRAWRDKNREKIRAQQRARYAANPAKYKAQQRAMHAAHPERKRYAAKMYNAANSERKKAYYREYNSKHAAKKSRASLLWQHANPEKARLQKKRAIHKRRALLRDSGSTGFTSAQWLSLVERFGGCCAYCGKPGTTIDHVVPIAAGGRDEISNVLPACKSCNASKGNKVLAIWLAQKGYVDPRSKAA
jgi:5-methylcytosine-specific restriction endonuclease McrA